MYTLCMLLLLLICAHLIINKYKTLSEQILLLLVRMRERAE